MELFYAEEFAGNICSLGQDEAGHCVRVLRHRCGDEINVIDGQGTMYRCRLVNDSPKSCEAEIVESFPQWGSHPYHLTMAVCPTKNNDRFEWFVEKATEVGMDVVAPVIGEHSERKVYKTDRAVKIALSATKQSLKASIPVVTEPVSVKQFIKDNADADALKLIAYCFEDESHPRTSIKVALENAGEKSKNVIVMIGPEGDFSKDEAKLAIESGFVPVHLGTSRLRTETAAVTAAEAVYFAFMD